MAKALKKIKPLFEPDRVIGELFEESKKVMDKKIPELEDYRYIADAKIPPDLRVLWENEYPNRTVIPPVEVCESVEDISSDMYSRLFPDENFAKLRAGDEDDERSIDAASQVLKAYGERSGLIDVADEALTDVITDGFVVATVQWDTYPDGKSEGPMAILHPLNRWFPSFDNRNLRKRSNEFFQEMTTLKEVEREAKTRGYDKAALRAVASEIRIQGYRPPDSISREFENWEKGLRDEENTIIDENNPPVELLHFWFKTYDEKNEKHLVGVQTFINQNTEHVLRCIQDPTGFNELPGIIGYIKPTTKTRDRIFPMGIPELLYPHWIVSMKYQSYAIEEGRWALFGGKVLFSADGGLRDLTELQAGDIIPLDLDKSQVFDVNYHQDMFLQTAALSGNNMHRLAGSNDYSSGVNPRRTETARGASFLMQGSAKKTTKYNKRFFRSFCCPIYRRFMKLIGDHAGIKAIRNILGKDWRDFPEKKLQKALSRNYDYLPVQTLEVTLPEEDERKMVAFYSISGNNPGFNQEDLNFRVCRAFNIQNAETLVITTARQKVVTDQENYALLQGVPIPVHPAEDKHFHLQEHMKFKQQIDWSPELIPITDPEIMNDPEKAKAHVQKVFMVLQKHIMETIQGIEIDEGGQLPMGAARDKSGITLGKLQGLTVPGRVPGQVTGEGTNTMRDLLGALGGGARNQ